MQHSPETDPWLHQGRLVGPANPSQPSYHLTSFHHDHDVIMHKTASSSKGLDGIGIVADKKSQTGIAREDPAQGSDQSSSPKAYNEAEGAPQTNSK